jgi:DNA-directed RNA polymerase subunit RPC12/RpoP
MGSYYSLYDRECPYCGKKISEIVYATCYEDYGPDDEWMGNQYTCEYCNKKFDIEMKFVLEKKKGD